jgi:chromosome segregation ATPase
MTEAPLTPATAEHESLRTRIQSYARLMAIIADQLEALDQGRALRYQELSAERERLQRELDAARGDDESPSDGVDALAPLLHHTLQEIESEAETQARLRARLTEIRDASLQAIRRLELRSVRGGEYYPKVMPTRQLDVRR